MRRELIQRFSGVLADIDDCAAQEFRRCSQVLLDHVNKSLKQREDLPILLGPSSVDIMESNHANHVDFIASIFCVRSAATLVDTVKWVYCSYISRGFSPDYFIVELQAWKEAVVVNMSPTSAGPVIRFYDAMIDSHPLFVSLAMEMNGEARVEIGAPEHYENFLAAVLQPNAAQAIDYTKRHIKSVADIQDWWLGVIRPVMYEVGRLWAEGRISVGQEHLATAITQRVMSVFYPLILEIPRNKGNIVFAVSPGEFHELGLHMMADLLEMKGWSVFYLGLHTLMESVIDTIKRYSSNTLCISTTLPSNLANTQRLISKVRAGLPDFKIRILVGGQAYLHDPELWKVVGADGYAETLEEAERFLKAAV